jgi:hypothetical protein
MTKETNLVRGSSVIREMLKRLAQEEEQWKRQKREGSVGAVRPPKSRAAEA